MTPANLNGEPPAILNALYHKVTMSHDSPELKIIRATHLGMCFGVRDAIQLATHAAADGPLTILGDLVHNERVVSDLRARGVQIRSQLDAVTTDRVMITAHGASNKAVQRVQERGFRMLEATCPLVHFAHRSLFSLVAAGYYPVVIGKRDHVEVRGMTEDLESFDVVLTAEDVERLPERECYGVVAQTTQPIQRVQWLVALIRERFPRAKVAFRDTVCQPTKQRQSAAVALAQQADLVIVIGGANSNNTRELAATCARHCPRVVHVQSARDLRPEWLEGVATVGLTAGTSTPDPVIDAVEARVREWAGAGCHREESCVAGQAS